MGAEIPKQFLKVCGKEIIIRTIEIFEKNDNIDEIYVVCIENWIKRLEKLIKLYEIDKVIKIIPGGTSGQDSIYKGLIEIKKIIIIAMFLFMMVLDHWFLKLLLINA